MHSAENNVSITFAIAAYNCADVLENCVESIASQADCCVDILIVDDGSTDETKELAVRLSGSYPGVTAFRQENAGPSGARNASIRNAKGEYVVFMDADDALPRGAVKTYERVLSRFRPDICFGNYFICEGVSRHLSKSVNTDEGAFDSSAQMTFASCCLEGLGFSKSETTKLTGAVWGKAYRRAFLSDNNLFFDLTLPRAQDIDFNIKAVLAADSFFYVDEPVYEYMVIEGSRSHKTNPHLLDDMKAFSRSVRDSISASGSSSLMNDYYLLSISEIESISVRGGYLDRGLSLKQAINLVAEDEVYAEAVAGARVRSVSRLKENLKIFLYKTRSYGLLARFISVRNFGA